MGDHARQAGQMSHVGARCKEPSVVYRLLTHGLSNRVSYHSHQDLAGCSCQAG